MSRLYTQRPALVIDYGMPSVGSHPLGFGNQGAGIVAIQPSPGDGDNLSPDLGG